jgi:hypothetical protein
MILESMITNLHRNQNMYHLPHPRIELFKKSPLYQLPLCWNDLDATKHHQNKTTFTIVLKDKLIEELIQIQITSKSFSLLSMLNDELSR